jgi:cyanophycinase
MISASVPRPGMIVAIGGAEDKTSRAVILSRVFDLAPDGGREIGVITTASGIPDEVFPAYREAFVRLGATNVHHLNVRERADARRPEHAATVERCGLVFMSGGDQLRLTHVLGGSPLLGAMRAASLRGAVIAGTSAGAAAMSSTMIYNGAATDALRKGAVKMSAGLGFLNGVVIDSHFLERGRFTRLMEAGATNPEYIGIGIGEDAAVIVHDGRVLEAMGSGHVIVVDCTELNSSNVAELSDGEPVAVSHVVMHALTSGFGYDLQNRRFLRQHDLNSYLERVSRADSGAASTSRAELL